MKIQIIQFFIFSFTCGVIAQTCDGIYSMRQDRYGYFGVVTIANPDYYRNFVIVDLTLAKSLSSVSKQTCFGFWKKMKQAVKGVVGM
jgi:hypothetical protein